MFVNLYLYMSIIAVIHLNINIPTIHREHCGNIPQSGMISEVNKRGKHPQPGSNSFRRPSGVDIARAVFLFLMSVTLMLNRAVLFCTIKACKTPKMMA